MRQQLALFDACANANYTLFNAVKNASKYYDEDNMPQYQIVTRPAGPHDARMSQPDHHIFNGFTPLCYMCYSDMQEAFKLYYLNNSFEQFYNDYTITDNRMNAIGIDRQCDFLMPRDSNYLQILLMRNATKILSASDPAMQSGLNMDNYISRQMMGVLPLKEPEAVPEDFTRACYIDTILGFSSDKAKAMMRQQNGRGFTLYGTAVMCANCGSQEEFGHGYHSFKVLRSVDCMVRGMAENVEGYANPWFLACFYGRINVLKLWWSCMNIDIEPAVLEELFKNTDPETIKAINIRELLIKSLLSYQGELPYTAACEKKIDYVKFGTSSSQKQECKKLISEILEYCLQYIQVLHQDNEYDGFREYWSNPKSCTVTLDDGTIQTVSYPEYNRYEKPRKLILREWFDCVNIPFISQQLLKLRRTKEEEETDFSKQIYKNFMLIHYAILNDNVQVYKLIRYHEGTVFTNSGDGSGKYVVQRGNQRLDIPDGTTTLQFAILLNATNIITFILKEFKEKQNEFPYASQVDKDGNNIIVTACESNNEAGRLIFQCPDIISNENLYIEQSTTQDGTEVQGFNVYITCIKNNCMFGLKHLVSLMNQDDGVNNIKDALERQEKNASSLTEKQMVVLMILAGKDVLKDTSIYPHFQIKAYANMLFNMAVEYIVQNRLHKTSIYKELSIDWKILLEQAIGDEEAKALIQKLDRQDNRNNIYFWGRKQKGVDENSIQLKLETHDAEMEDIVKTALDEYYLLGKYECQIIQDDNNMVETQEKDENDKTKRDFDVDEVFEKKQEPEDHVWFDACKNGDMDQIRNLAMLCVQTRDKRPTDLFEFTSQAEQPNYRGMTGLMYAIINNQIEVVNFLLPLEGHLGTQLPYSVPSFAYGDDHFMYLAKGSDVEKLAIISGNDVIFQIVAEYFKQYNLERLFKKGEEAKLQSKSSLCIINNRKRPITIDDLSNDARIFRHLIQYQKINQFIDLFQNILTDRFVPVIVQQMTYCTIYKGQNRNNYDVALKFACQQSCGIPELDESYQHCESIILQLSQQMIEVLVKKNKLNSFDRQIDDFYKSVDAPKNIDTLLQKRSLIQQDQLNEEQLVLQDRCVLNDSTVQSQELPFSLESYNCVAQDQLTNIWFDFCRENRIKQVRELGRRFPGSVERRTTSLSKQVHYGASGLMYAAIYDAPDVFSYLFEYEWQIRVKEPILYLFEGIYYYLPKDSNILHLLVQLNDPKFFRLTMNQPQFHTLFNQFNIYGMIPFFLMLQQKYCRLDYFVRFIGSCSEFQLNRAIELSVESHTINDEALSNLEFARLLTHFNKKREGNDGIFGSMQPSRVSVETTYLYILSQLQQRIKDKVQPDGSVSQEDLDASFNPAEQELYHTRNEAVVYAFTKNDQFEHLQQMQPEQAAKKSKWAEVLKTYYGSEDEYEKKYQAFKAFNRYVQDGAVVESEDKIIANNLLFSEAQYIKSCPTNADCFIVSNQALQSWFDATNPELEAHQGRSSDKLLAQLEQAQNDLNDVYLQSFISQVDNRFNDQQRNIYHGFTALMYSIVYDNLDAFKYLLTDRNMKEASVQLMYQNVCKVAGLDGEEEKYYLIQPQTPLLHLMLIFNASKIMRYISGIARGTDTDEYSDVRPNSKIIGNIYQQWRSYNTMYLALQLSREIEFVDLHQYLISRNYGENIVSTSVVFKNLVFADAVAQKYIAFFDRVDEQLNYDQQMQKDDDLDLTLDAKPEETLKMTQRTQYANLIDKRCLEEMTYLILKADDIRFDVSGPEFNAKDLDPHYNALYRLAYNFAVQRAESSVFYQLLQQMNGNKNSWHVDTPDEQDAFIQDTYRRFPKPDKAGLPEFNYLSIVPKEPQFESDELYQYDNDIRAFKERKEASHILMDGTIYSVINSAYVIHDQKVFIKDFDQMQQVADEELQEDKTLEERIIEQQKDIDSLQESKLLRDIENARIQFNLCGKDIVTAYDDAKRAGGLSAIAKYENCKVVEGTGDKEKWKDLAVPEDQIRFDNMLAADQALEDIKDQLLKAKTQMRQLQEDAWFQACKYGDVQFVRQNFDKFVGIRQRRDYNVQLYRFKGWTGLCYAAYFNQLDVVRLLFASECMLTTRYDTIVDAYAVGFGEMFLVSRDSTPLILAVLSDNRAVTQWILQQVEKDVKLYDHYANTNCRGQPNLFVVAITWRTASGKLLFNSPLVQNAIQTANHQLKSGVINPLAVIQLTRSAFICTEFYKKMSIDTAFKLSAYALVLKSNMQLLYKTIQEDSVGETDIARLFFRLVYQDAITYALKNRTEIQWYNMLKQNLGHLRCKMVESVFETTGKIEVIEKRDDRGVRSLDFSGMTLLLETQIRTAERARQALNTTSLDITRMDQTAVSTIKPTIDSHDTLTLSMLAQTQKIDVIGKDQTQMVDDTEIRTQVQDLNVSRILEQDPSGCAVLRDADGNLYQTTGKYNEFVVKCPDNWKTLFFMFEAYLEGEK